MVAFTKRHVLLAGGVAGLVAFAYKSQREANKGEEGKDGKPVSLAANIKIVDVIRYVAMLIRDLTHPERLTLNKRDYVKQLLAMVWPKWHSGATAEEAKGRREIVSLFALAVVKTVLLDRSSGLIRALTATVYRRDRSAFRALLKESALLTVAGSAVQALYNHSKDTLTVHWRERLTRIIHDKYYTLMNFYHVGNLPGRAAITDPDERLAREVMSVSGRLTNLISLLASSLPPIVWCTLKLWRWRGFAFAMVPHVYLLLAYEVAQRMLPKNIGELYRAQAMSQGGYFKAATRVQTHSEAIAAIGGSEREEAIIKKKFSYVSGAAENLHLALSKFGLIFKLAYTYGCRSWITSFIMLPLVTSTSSSAASLPVEVADVQYSTQQMTGMLVATGNLLTLHATAQHMIGTSKRIYTLINTLKDLEAKQKQTKATTFTEGEDVIRFEKVQVYTPTGLHLVKDLTFELKQGGSLLLTGHNGAGKSSIFRCLGGLWKVPEGSITKPGAEGSGLHEHIFYLPQKPYNVLGSLRDQLTYPEAPAEAKLSDAQVADLLARVDLSHLLTMTAEQGEEGLINWDDKLSLGEQQRLAMARLFYHKPKFAVLDECTSAVSSRMEKLLYDQCRAMGITYITICHRPALRQYHDTNLNLTGDGKGGWELHHITHDAPLELARDAAAADAHAPEDAQGQKDAKAWQEVRNQGYKAARRAVPKRSALSKLRKLLKIMVPGSGKRLLALATAIGLRTLCHESHSFIVGAMFTRMLARDVRGFAGLAVLNVLQDLSTAWVEEAVVYLQNVVSVSWHKQLTRHATDLYFQNNAFYNLKNLDKRILDPDQRLTQEIADLSDHFAQIWGQAITPLVDIAWFSVRLHAVLGFQGMSSMYMFVMACWAMLKLCMPDHKALNTREKRLESQFRFVHTRLRSHAESVAFFGGDKREREIADNQLQQLVQHMHKVRAANAKFKFAFHAVNKDFSNPASLISAPDLLTLHMQMEHSQRAVEAQEQGAGEGEGDLAGSSYYVQSAVNRTINAFGKLTNLYEQVAKLLGSSTRVCEMLDVLEQMHTQQLYGAPQDQQGSQDNTSVIMQNCDIVTPDGVCLVKDLTLEAHPGKSLMVTGPNAVGKTSLFRVLAGLWPVANRAQGAKVTRPPQRSVFLVPQRVYSVSGTLADQVTYPDKLSKRDAAQEAELLAVLDRVGIAYLAERKGGWDAKCSWENTLSLGEQQRMGLARLFYHKPAFGVLDECTDAVSVDVEESLYSGLHEIGVTCITISKRLALTQFHDSEVKLGVPSLRGWELKSLHSGARATAAPDSATV